MSDLPEIRVADADRERAVVALREHAVAGRLTLEEFGERVDQAYAARTRGAPGRPHPDPRVLADGRRARPRSSHHAPSIEAERRPRRRRA